MTGRGRRPGVLTVALIAVVAAGTSCGSSHRTESARTRSTVEAASATRQRSPEPPRATFPVPVPAPTPTPTPTRTPTGPYLVGPAPAGTPGALAGWVAPTTSVAYSAKVWFRGVLLEEQAGKLVVVYPALAVSSDGTQVVAHIKLPVFLCTRRAGPTSPNFVGCIQRRVEYGDLAKPGVTVQLTGAQELTVDGQFPTYVYGTGVDRGPQLPLRWTGRTFPVQLTVTPLLPLRHRHGGLVATGRVTIGEHTAVADLAYPGVLVLPHS